MFDRIKKLLQPPRATQRYPALGRLEATLEPIRESYQRSLRSSLEERRREFSDRRVTPELMIDFHQASEFPRNYYRLDLHVAGPVEARLDGKLIDVNTGLHQPAVTTFELPGLVLVLQPFFWGACHFLLSGEPGPDLRAELIRWFEYWIDIEDERPALYGEWQGVVHNASMSGVGTAAWSLDIDFGSAPTAAFLELIQLIQAHFSGQVLVETVWAGDGAQPPIN